MSDTQNTVMDTPAANPGVEGRAVRVRRAILSVYDKTGIVELARALKRQGVEIISTGGTMTRLTEAGIEVTSVESITGFGSMLGGRVKTLHPNLMGGVLARRDVPSDEKQLKDAGIELCDLVVINLYPFSQAADDPDASLADAIELIDVGGPTMIRAAAKNHAWVTVVCDPSDYGPLAEEVENNNGSVSAATRRRLAIKAFATTAEYDAKIASHLASAMQDDAKGFPDVWIQAYRKVGTLRYGENPHQSAAVYTKSDGGGASLATADVTGGKLLSYNNYGDLDAAWRMAADFDEPFAAVFKHANPCGAAIGNDIREAYELAYATDPLSAYGSVVALNRRVDLACAEALNETTFVECVLAPGYDPDAMELMRKKKTRRYITVPTMNIASAGVRRFRDIVGGLLVQDDDVKPLSESDLKVVTESRPTPEQIRSLLFARKVVKHAKSNAIVLARGTAAVGIGSGQTSRVDAVISAVQRAGDRAKGSVLASDAFFPMSDGPEAAAKAGVTAIIQPGGSKRDGDVIATCNLHRVAMVFSGMRNFRH
ncbi:MAG: bifunctional phosphoribosylaminoimidazolecarboxamide formyltransferase/IMP cyclohydrolase [Candidatus Zixiibacteriota bacterium]